MAQTRVVVAGVLVVVAGLTAAVAGLAGEAAAGDARWPWPVDWVRVHAWWVPAASMLLGVVLAVAAMLVQRPGADAGDPPSPSPLPVEDWWVDREQASVVIAAVRAGGCGTVGITTGLHGAGGFGKTTPARVVCADHRVGRRFRGRVYTVTIGRDVRGRAAIAAKIAEATRLITGDLTPFDDPQLAGAHLGRLLDRWGRGGGWRGPGRGAKRTVRRWLQPLRASGRPAPKVSDTPPVRLVTQWLTRHPDSFAAEETLQLKRILARSPELQYVSQCGVGVRRDDARPPRMRTP
ncbi:hypothetical protein [Embleya sp. NPDC001921]